jgi:recombinational DNA repair protein RecT
MGLEPGFMNEAWLIPYGKECTAQTGYMGLIKCAMRSGEVEYIHPNVVYEGDIFDEELGSERKLIHKPMRKVGAKPILYYAVAKLKTGGSVWEVMSVEQIEAHRDQYAKGHRRADSAWNTNFDGMAKKTVVKKVCKYLPKSVELAYAFNHDAKNGEKAFDAVRMDNYHAIQSAPDIDKTADALAVELETLKGHLAIAQKEKVDISDVGDPGELLKLTDHKKLHAINDVLAERLESL